MTDENNPLRPHSVNTEQKTEFVEIDGNTYEYIHDAVQEPYAVQPKRRYAEKTVKGIVIGRGDTQQIIPLEQVKKLAELNCSYADMAKFFGVKENTFRDNFRFEVERSREILKHRLMQAMITNAIDKMNPTVQIWLSKNLLGFTDNPVSAENTTVLPWLEGDE